MNSVWALVMLLMATDGEVIEKTYVERFSSKAVCESWIPVAKEAHAALNFKYITLKGIECREEKVITKPPKEYGR